MHREGTLPVPETSLPDSGAGYYTDVLGTTAGKKRGFTTGTAAQAAVKAAVSFALSGREEETVTVTLPPGKKPFSGCRIRIPVAFYTERDGEYHAGIVKDAGDDTDITNGAVIAARVRLGAETEHPADSRVILSGGEGVGRVSAPGLPVPPGESAINPVPRKMILREIEELLDRAGGSPSAEVEIYVPEGKRLAEKTWNPRLGIEGGISIIGTSGVVEPKSSEAYKNSIKAVIRSMEKRGRRSLVITPGYVGEKFLFTRLGISENRVATVGDHIGWAFTEAAKRGFTRGVFAGHIGKCVKIAAGIFNTHWSSGDARLETIAAWAAYEGAPTETVRAVLSAGLAEESIAILREAGVETVFSRIAEQCVKRLSEHLRREADFDVSCVLLDLYGDPLAAEPSTLTERDGWAEYR